MQQPVATVTYDTVTHEWVASVGGDELARVATAPGHETAALASEMTEVGRKLGEAMARLFL